MDKELKMDLYETIVNTYPELETGKEFSNGSIILQDDSDGVGPYIREWNYEQPIPTGLKLGKPKVK
jgi:hypothetical protein